MTEQNTTEAATGEDLAFAPTALYLMEATDAGALEVAAATAPAPTGDALLVFRSEADAEAFRARSGKHPAAEGWRPLGLNRELVAGLLDLHGLGPVVMPHEWTGAGGSDLFTAANFLELLESCEPA